MRDSEFRLLLQRNINFYVFLYQIDKTTVRGIMHE